MSKVQEFEKLIHDSTSALAKLIVQEQNHEGNLLSSGARENKLQHELEVHIKNMERKMEAGLHACIGSLDQCHDLPKMKKEVIEELYHCFQPINSAEALHDMGTAVFSEITWKSKLGISQDCMESLYQGAKFLFDQRNFDESEKAFFMLCALDSAGSAYWTGWGHSSFYLHLYKQAIDAYSMASMLHPEDVWPHIWAGNCFEKEKDIGHAQMAFRDALVLEQAKQKPDTKLIHSLERRLQKK